MSTFVRPALAPLLAVWLLAACGGPPQAEPEPPASAGPAREEAPLGESSRQLLGWLPESGGVDGWTRSREPRRYDPGNLWEYINGAAEAFLAFGFQEAASAEYTAAGGLRVTLDIYRMNDAVGAFGMFTEEANPEAALLAVGAEGYRTANALNFWAGTCYVKLTAQREDPAAPGALEAFARETARRIGPAGSRPAAFGRFPTANLVPRSFKVVPRDILGQSYLSNGFEARYRAGTATWRLLLVPFETDAEATAGFASYRDFVASAGKPVRAVEAGAAGFAGQDGYYGLVVAARAGRHLAIALGAPGERVALAHVSALLR